MIRQATERIDPTGLTLEERILDIWRCAAVIKGGRRFSFASMVVIGNRTGVLALGYGKAREVPSAIEKALKDARKNLVRVPMYGTTIPHEARGRYETAEVVLIPALPGTGLIAGEVTRAILECLGVHDVLTKSVGGCNNPKNLARATMEALRQLRSREQVAKLRGVEIAEDPVMAKSLKATPVARRVDFSGMGRGDRGPGDRRGRDRGPRRDAGQGRPEPTRQAPAAEPTRGRQDAGGTPAAEPTRGRQDAGGTSAPSGEPPVAGRREEGQ